MWIRIGLNWIRFRIQFFMSMQLRIQWVQPKRIHADPDPVPGQIVKSHKV